MPTHTLPDGRALPYEEGGAGPAILLLAREPSQTLRPLVAVLGALGRVIVPGLPAWADPPRVPADAAALLTALGAAPASVVGIGDGAGAALTMAVAQPDVVHRVIGDSPALGAVPEAALGDIMCHVVLVWGAEDPAMPPRDKGRIALQVPRAQRVDYPGAGGAFATCRERFLTDLRRWLRQDPAPARLPMNETRPTRGAAGFEV